MGYFKEMFEEAHSENRKISNIEINCDPKVFRIILNFCTDESHLSNENEIKILGLRI